MTIKRAQRPDGVFAELQMNQDGRLKIETAAADSTDEAAPVVLKQNDSGELLTAQGGG